LIPGATYRFIERTNSPQVHKEFTINPGETLDLGEIRVERLQ
jgi:hypothetical protein